MNSTLPLYSLKMSSPEDFRGDFGELAALMKESWAGNSQEPLLYTEKFLQSFLAQPGASFSLCAAIYDEGELIAFGAGFPRTVTYAGREWTLMLDSFITVSPGSRGKNLGAVIWHHLVALARRKGYDGLITFCVAGEHMDRKLVKFAQGGATATQKVFAVSYLARPMPRNRPGIPAWADAAILKRGAENLKAGLKREWTQAEAVWQCKQRLDAFGCSLQEGHQEGTISAYAMTTGGAKPARCGLVDAVVWEGAQSAQRVRMVEMLLDSARAMEVDLLLIPMLNCFDAQPFLSAGFRRTRRILHMYLTSWNSSLEFGELDAISIDVL